MDVESRRKDARIKMLEDELKALRQHLNGKRNQLEMIKYLHGYDNSNSSSSSNRNDNVMRNDTISIDDTRVLPSVSPPLSAFEPSPDPPIFTLTSNTNSSYPKKKVSMTNYQGPIVAVPKWRDFIGHTLVLDYLDLLFFIDRCRKIGVWDEKYKHQPLLMGPAAVDYGIYIYLI